MPYSANDMLSFLIPIGISLVAGVTGLVIVIVICCYCRGYRKKPSGLKNTMETCYLNAMIQAMASSEKLIDDLKRIDNKEEKLNILTDLLEGINNPRNLTVNEITNKLKSFTETVAWNKDSQQDAFELLSFFINAIQKDLHDTLQERNIAMPPKFKLLHTFTESDSFNRVQDHLALSIPLCGSYQKAPGEYLISLIDEFFKPSLIDDGPHETQMFLYKDVPDVMILHIQANQWDAKKGGYIKSVYHIMYEEILKYVFTIKTTIDGLKSKRVEVTYKLKAVVHHMGTIRGGHYVCYRQYDHGWYLTNDEQVDKMDFEFRAVPYVMVYQKFDEQIVEVTH